MSPPDATIAVQEHLLQDSESSDQKPRLAAGDDEIQQDGATQPQKLQRYWVRTIVLILVPAIITAWYGIIWVALVLGIEHDEVVKYRTYDGSMVFYSWFIIGVFGLAWGKYGLVGVEVAMLQTPFWKAPNMVVFLMHSNTTWNSYVHCSCSVPPPPSCVVFYGIAADSFGAPLGGYPLSAIASSTGCGVY